MSYYQDYRKASNASWFKVFIMKINPLLLIFLFTVLNSCDYVVRTDEKASRELIERDLEFSEYSQEYGVAEAFTAFADSAAVLLKPDRMPIKGSKSIAYYYSGLGNQNFKLTWMPLDASLADSKEMGYTYGIWQLTTSDSIRQGTYVTIWKKNEEGVWKYVLDSGNEGIGKME